MVSNGIKDAHDSRSKIEIPPPILELTEGELVLVFLFLPLLGTAKAKDFG